MNALVANNGWYSNWAVLLQRIRLVQSSEEENALFSALTGVQQPTVLAFANAHTFNEVCNGDFATTMQQADIVLRDGVGVSGLFRLMGRDSGLNMNGTDLIPELLEYLAPKTLALFGTEEQYVEEASRLLRGSLSESTSFVTADGFQPPEYYVRAVQEHRPQVIVLGMGVPKQEIVAEALRSNLDYPCLIVCGGAILDFLGGKVDRAPAWIRRLRSEWVYRLYLEPKRLFRRYVIGVPVFCIRTLFFIVYFHAARKRQSEGRHAQRKGHGDV